MQGKFDLICTATLRPELIKRTFDSHIKHLFRDNIKNARLIMNVDMIGSDEPEKDFDNILRYVDKIPFAEININKCQNPSFSRAFYWLLGQINEPLTFNLEEDWELNQDIDFDKMIELFSRDKDLVHLRLSMFDSYYLEGDDIVNESEEIKQYEMKTWNKFIKWNGEFFGIPRTLRGVIGWAGHPSLNRTAFLLAFATVLDKNKNHEKQIKGHKPILLNSHFGVFHPKEAKSAIKDIGREWMVKNKMEKKGTNAFFTEWQKVEK